MLCLVHRHVTLPSIGFRFSHTPIYIMFQWHSQSSDNTFVTSYMDSAAAPSHMRPDKCNRDIECVKLFITDRQKERKTNRLLNEDHKADKGKMRCLHSSASTAQKNRSAVYEKKKTVHDEN